MDNCNRTKPENLRWLIALGAAAGTFLLVFAPWSGWLSSATQTDEILSAVLFKQLLTVLLLMIVPSLWARLAHLTGPLALALLTGLAFGCGLLLSDSFSDAAYAALLAAIPGAGLYLLQRLKLSNFRTVLYESFLILAALFCRVCLPDMIRSGNAYLSVRWILDLYGQSLEGLRFDMNVLGGMELLNTAQEAVRQAQMSPEAVAVPILLAVSMAAALADVLFSHLWNKKGGAALPALPRFPEWRCERWYVVLIAAFSLVTILMRLFGAKSGEALSSVADILWRMPCALAGLCAVRKLSVQSRRVWIFWLTAVMLAVLPPVALLVLTIVGMLASLRAPKKTGEDGMNR